MDYTKAYKKERKEVASFMRRLYEQGLTTTSGGNISMRTDDNMIIITPSGTDKGRMRWRETGVMNMPGENLTPELKLSMEHDMHLMIYRKRPDVTAIVHAHPLFATSFTTMKNNIDTSLTAEARAICGEPRLVPYALMGTSKLAELAAENIDNSDILLLENHGILTTGSGILQAFDRLEVLEQAAKMTLITELCGRKRPLGRIRLRELDRMFR